MILVQMLLRFTFSSYIVGCVYTQIDRNVFHYIVGCVIDLLIVMIIMMKICQTTHFLKNNYTY